MKRLYSLLLITLLFSCSKKDSSKCYTYDIDSWCEPKRSDVYGCTHTYSTGVQVCKDYPEGYTEKTNDDANAVSYRKYYNKR